MSSNNPKAIRYLIEHFNEPVVFKKMLNWDLLKWSLEDWQNNLPSKKYSFRKHLFKYMKRPAFERDDQIELLTLAEFIELQKIANPKYSLYFNYEHLKLHPEAEWSSVKNDINWAMFGYPEISGVDCTLWIGSPGAHTACHMDTYGCNLIAQVYERKEWILFPPEVNLKPSRTPYEDSTVYSELNFFTPDVEKFKELPGGRVVVLEPGDVLYVPPSWWHYVENIETAISINMWIAREEDHKKRVEEALTQLFVKQIIYDVDHVTQNLLLNPNMDYLAETGTDTAANILKRTVELYLKYKEEKREQNNKRLKLENSSKQIVNFDIDKIIENSENISVVPIMSTKKFQQLILEKSNRYNITDACISDEEPPIYYILKNAINAFCHPNNIAQVADTFLNSFKTNI